MSEGIRNIEISEDAETGEKKVEVVFGPHHAVRIDEDSDGVCFELVFTHHGFEADASGEVPTDLEKFIKTVREEHPESTIDTF